MRIVIIFSFSSVGVPDWTACRAFLGSLSVLGPRCHALCASISSARFNHCVVLSICAYWFTLHDVLPQVAAREAFERSILVDPPSKSGFIAYGDFLKAELQLAQGAAKGIHCWFGTSMVGPRTHCHTLSLSLSLSHCPSPCRRRCDQS